MLPNRMNLDRKTEENLKRLKQNTGVTPNVLARIAFFRSVESNFVFSTNEKKLDGNLILDKITWLGETVFITEQVLKMKYPEMDSKQLMIAWANHVEDGIASLRNHKSLINFAQSIN
ncbi:MAG: DNA sulfur modification protein DndE [Gammaproteobacteria bacterium]|nr:DNA sulfur modification protein DndE [Gammaproteobacteria bacterium]